MPAPTEPKPRTVRSVSYDVCAGTIMLPGLVMWVRDVMHWMSDLRGTGGGDERLRLLAEGEMLLEKLRVKVKE